MGGHLAFSISHAHKFVCQEAGGSTAGLFFHMLPRIISAPMASAAHIMRKLARSSMLMVDFANETRPNSSRYLGTASARLTATMIMMVPITTLIICSLTYVVPIAPS